jgi:hypothetical protein
VGTRFLKHKHTPSPPKDHKTRERVIIVAVLFGMICLSALFWSRVYSRQPRLEYEGKILDKWASYSYTEQGSFPYYKLLIEADNGETFKVDVDYDTYQRAQIGMRIKRTLSGIELSADIIPSPNVIMDHTRSLSG